MPPGLFVFEALILCLLCPFISVVESPFSSVAHYHLKFYVVLITFLIANASGGGGGVVVVVVVVLIWVGCGGGGGSRLLTVGVVETGV